jgi:hypothetical protein
MRWMKTVVAASVFINCGCTTVVEPVAVAPRVLGTGSAIVLKVQNMVRNRCRFNVTADSVGAILGGAYEPDAIADAICLSVLQSRTDPSTPRVNGVAIIGRFMR